jgi:hypothetical protein
MNLLAISGLTIGMSLVALGFLKAGRFIRIR